MAKNIKTELKAADQPPDNTPYIIALVVMVMLGIASLVFITYVRPDQDNTALLTIVFGFIVTISGQVMLFMKQEQSHQSTNSRMGELLQLKKEEGVREGQEKNVT